MHSLVWLFLLGLSSQVWADTLSFGQVAVNMTEPIEAVSGFVSIGCLIVGVGCIFASIVKYFEHRRSPLHVPISTVVWLLIIGLLLLLLPFAYIITDNGIPFRFLWGSAT